jgi:predicted alpha/beta-hydrolase family hydrolase
MTALELDTPHGVARAHLQSAEAPRAALVLGHGAGGGVGARDITAAAHAALAEAFSVALVEQPYRVAGRRAPAPAAQLDAAWIAAVDALRAGPLGGLPIVAGGRSSGGRVACRTAAATGAIAVLCLAFPLRPPRPPGRAPAPSRLPELDAVPVPALIVQGARDPFGVPPEAPARAVVQVDADHGLRTDLRAVAAAVGAWLRALPPAAPAEPAPILRRRGAGRAVD